MQEGRRLPTFQPLALVEVRYGVFSNAIGLASKLTLEALDRGYAESFPQLSANRWTKRIVSPAVEKRRLRDVERELEASSSMRCLQWDVNVARWALRKRPDDPQNAIEVDLEVVGFGEE